MTRKKRSILTWFGIFLLGGLVGTGITLGTLVMFPQNGGEPTNSLRVASVGANHSPSKTTVLKEKAVQRKDAVPALGALQGASHTNDTHGYVAAHLGSGKPLGIQRALLLNGGAQLESNYFSHHLHIRMLSELLLKRGLPRRKIDIFSTDGESANPDQMLVKSLSMKWLFDELPEAQLISPARFVNTTLPGFSMKPARLGPLRRYFRKVRAPLQKKPSTLFLFVTDHGTQGEGPLGNKIELWKQQLNVRELRNMLRPLGKKTRVVSVMSQCYSGGFANLLYRAPNRVHGNRCGFFSTIASREAYGCFPETAQAERVGHAYRMIRAMQTSKTFVEAHRKTLLSDVTPDVPLATSDIYIRDQVRRMARERRTSLTKLVDRTLRKVWRENPQSLVYDLRLLRALQKRFGLTKQNSIRSVWSKIRKNRMRQKRLLQVDSWEKVLREVRQRSLIQYYQHAPTIAQRVEQEMQRPEVDGQTRRVGKGLYQGYLAFLRGKKPMRKRLTQLHRRHDLIQKRVFQLHVREGVLLRMDMLLTRIAGRYLLQKQGSKGQRLSLSQLMRCEATSLGAQQVKGRLSAEGRPNPAAMRKKRQTLRQMAKMSDRDLLPSWLGIVFQPAPSGWHPKFSRLAPGASQVIEVGAGTPAERAGLQPGDIIASFDGGLLQFSNEIRDRVMLSSAQKKNFLLVYRNGRFRTLGVQLRRSQFSGKPIPTSPEPPVAELEPDRKVHGLRRKRLKRLAPPRKRQPLVGLTTLDGRPVSIASGKGPTMLFFWATWCEGCKTMVPLLRKLRQRYRSRGFRVLAVTTDQASMVRPFLRKWGSRFPFQVALDPQGKISRRYRIAAIPQVILFDKQGEQIVHLRRMPGDLPRVLDRQIRQALR